VLLREALDTGIQKESRRLEPHTLIILVWITAIQNKPGTNKEKYEIIVALLKWLSKHRRRLLLDTIGQEGIYRTPEAIRHDYERYIMHPTRKTHIYSELVLSMVKAISPEQIKLRYKSSTEVLA
jgi:hypothetical protein